MSNRGIRAAEYSGTNAVSFSFFASIFLSSIFSSFFFSFFFLFRRVFLFWEGRGERGQRNETVKKLHYASSSRRSFRDERVRKKKEKEYLSLFRFNRTDSIQTFHGSKSREGGAREECLESKL